jgi:hypothetical protein
MDNTIVRVKNKTFEIATIGELVIAPDSYITIWDTQTYNPLASANFPQFIANIGKFNQLVFENKATLIKNDIELSSSEVFETIALMNNFVSSISSAQNTLLVMKSRQDLVNLSTVPKIGLNAEQESDGRLTVTPTPIGFGWLTWFTGYGDDPSPVGATGRGEGQQIALEIEDGYGYKEISFSFAEPVHVHDGQVYWSESFTYKDHFSLAVDIPATVATPASGDGNANKVDTGLGFNMFIPGDGSGYWNIDLDTANDVSPVTVYGKNPNGMWDLDETTGIVRQADIFGSGSYNMFDAPMPRSYFIKRVPMGHPLRVFDSDVYKTELIHQNWNIVIEVTKTSPGAGWLSGWLLAFRRQTQ